MSSTSAAQPACTCGLIDVHAHCLSPTYRMALSDAGLTTLDGGYPVPTWSAELALGVMERDGIDTMMLSVSSPTVSFVADKGARVALARRINEDISATMATYPGRFGGFATLPLPHVPECLDELRYALDELGLNGVVLETNSDGKYLGHPDFTRIFEELARRGVPLFLHPTKPECFDSVGLGRPAPLFEFPVDTARTVIDMIFGGVFDRAPDLKLILPHAGGVLPSIARRIALMSGMPVMKPGPKSGIDVMRIFGQIHYDLAMSANQQTFDSLRTLASISHILFGTDFPFQPTHNVQANVESFRNLAGLDEGEHRAIARENAKLLFPRLVTD